MTPARRRRGAGGGVAAAVLTLVLLIALAVVADQWLTRTAEDQAARRIGAALDAPAEVELRGWPVSLRLLNGHVPEARLRMTDVPLQTVPPSPARLSRLEARFLDVRLNLAGLRGGGLPITGQGEFTAEMDSQTVGELVNRPGTVQLGPGVILLTIEGQEIEAIPTVEAGTVVLQPVTPVPGVPPEGLRLPALPFGAQIDTVGVTPEALAVSGSTPSLTPEDLAPGGELPIESGG